jgi:hypothetical protein
MVQADLGPTFELVPLCCELSGVEELEFCDHRLAFFDGIGGKFKDVDDAEVNTADFVGVVIEQGDHPILVGGMEAEFLIDFAFDRGLVGQGVQSEESLIVIVHVAADPDGAFGHEALFSRFFASDVVEYPASVDEKYVGDDLFKFLVGFGRSALGEEVVLPV